MTTNHTARIAAIYGLDLVPPRYPSGVITVNDIIQLEPDPKPLTAARLAEIRKRADAVLPGPWEWWKYGLRQGEHGEYIIHEADMCHAYSGEKDHPDPPVKDFLAAARTDIPDLLDEVERLRAQVVRLIMSQPTEADRLAALKRIDASPELRELIRELNTR